MRIWDLDPSLLCRQHLLGEHRELHGCWNIHVHGKTGYREHPETKRWAGKLAALYTRHEALVAEMSRRGYNHNTPLDVAHANDQDVQDLLLDSLENQREILRHKPCDCFLLEAA